MFTELTVEDKILIHPSDIDKHDALKKELELLYSNKIIPDEGICICIKEVIKIYSFQIIEGLLLCHCVFSVVLFKFFENEIIEGKILGQDEEGMKIGLSFFDSIYVKCENFMENCEKNYVKIDNMHNYVNWVWIYEGQKYFFRNNEKVRFKVLKVDYGSFNVFGSFDASGLGPVAWWI